MLSYLGRKTNSVHKKRGDHQKFHGIAGSSNRQEFKKANRTFQRRKGGEKNSFDLNFNDISKGKDIMPYLQ